METADERAVAAMRAGDSAAFEAVMRRYNQRMFRIARGVMGDDDDALDVVQEAYIRAYDRLAQLDEPKRLGAWLGRIVRNEALMAKRKGWRRARLGDDEVGQLTAEDALLAGRHVSGDERVAAAELRAALEVAIDALKPAHREVIMLRAVEGLSVRECAELLEVAEGTVKTRFFRAREELRARIERLVGESLPKAFRFDGARCDAVVAGVFRRLASR